MRITRRLLHAAFALAVTVPVAAAVAPTPAVAAPDILPVTVTNNTGLGGPTYLYILSENLANGAQGYVNANGTFTPWSGGGLPPAPAPDVAIAGPGNGGSTTLRIPRGVNGRIYFSFGEKLKLFLVPGGKLVQPAPWVSGDANYNILLDWSEFTYNDAGLWLNSSQVDMFAIPHAVSVTGANGFRSTGQVVSDGRNKILNGIRSQPGFERSVITRGDGTVLRALAPGKAADAGLMDPHYLDSYINSAWNAYTNRTLTVVPREADPNRRFFGRTSGDVMRFTDASGAEVATFNKPSTANVWGCDGVFDAPNAPPFIRSEIARTLCTALHRSTLGRFDVEPHYNAADFYKGDRTNHYSRIIHENMVDGKAYGFPYDDVGHFESLVHDPNPSSAGIDLSPFGPGGGGQPGAGRPIVGLAGKCVDVRGASSADGTPVQLYDCNNTSAQQWTQVGSTLRVYGKCLDISGNGTENGTRLLLWPCTGGGNQEWQFRGDATLYNPRSNRCLDVPDWNSANGNQLQIWDCHAGANQQWRWS